MGVEFLRQHNQASFVPLVKKANLAVYRRTSLTVLVPDSGAAYNGQMVKALVYFAIFVGLFQMADPDKNTHFCSRLYSVCGFLRPRCVADRPDDP